MTDKLVRASGQFLQRRVSRRGFVTRAALVGSALSVAPVRFLTRPMTAWGAMQPGDCPEGSRCRGYTEFCCSKRNLGNFCPQDTFLGGWWKATAPTGSNFCGGKARYYLDCNIWRKSNCDPGPGCFNDLCDCRKWCHREFSYWNCNTKYQDGRTSTVVCRIIRCQHPSKGGCSSRREPGCYCSRKAEYDPNTRYHGSCTGDC